MKITSHSGHISSSIPNVHKDRKAILSTAFRITPVLFAFLFSFFSMTFLVNLQPASAISFQNRDRAESPSYAREPSLFHATSEGSSHPLSHVFTREVLFWEEHIQAWAISHQLDPNLVATVMQIESCGHPNIESGAGAKGLFQVMPFHFAPGENPFDPDTNARRGLTYLSKSLQIASNDISLALAGYNGGHSVISLQPAHWAEETRRYVYWGSGILADISSGASQSSRLEEWMRAGGRSLCSRSSAELGF